MRFDVTNYKGIDSVSIEASRGDLVLVAGANGSGKSSFIDAITELFDARGIRVTPKPIRDGETRAVAEFESPELDIRIRRTWTRDDSGKLEVYALDGAKYPKPSDVLAQLTGGLVFDPGRFLTLDEKRQREELLAAVHLPIDLDALEREAAGARERRLEAGRDVKRLEGALASLPKPAPGTPAEIVSVGDLLTELRAAEELHQEARDRDAELTLARRQLREVREEIERLKVREAALVDRVGVIEFAAATAAQLPDLDEIRDRLDGIEQTNEAVRSAWQHVEVRDELEDARERHLAAVRDLEIVEQRKLAGLAAADWPDPGLSLDEGGVTLDGVPFRQANTARRILAAARIATAGDPRLRLVIVSNGDLLDADSLAAVQELAAERGFTVLMERDRDDSRQVGFEIREGRRVD